jgi:hypothetical protein
VVATPGELGRGHGKGRARHGEENGKKMEARTVLPGSEAEGAARGSRRSWSTQRLVRQEHCSGAVGLRQGSGACRRLKTGV